MEDTAQNLPVEQEAEHPVTEVGSSTKPTPVSNQIPPNSEAIAVELITGEFVSSERCSRWPDPVTGEMVYQVELNGKQYLGRMVEGVNKVELLHE